MEPGRTEGTTAATRPSAGGPPRAGDQKCRLFEELLETRGKSNRERRPDRTGTAKKGRTGGPVRDSPERTRASGRAAACGRRRGNRSASPARCGVGAGWGGQKKSRAKGPARVDQVGISACSVLAPTAHCGQTSQTGTEEQQSAGFGDGGTTC